LSDIDDVGRQENSRPAEAARTVQDKASDGAALVGDKAAEVGRTAKEQGANAVGEATAQTRALLSDLRDQLESEAGQQTQRLADNVRRLSDELREMSENGKPDSAAAGVVRQVADGGHQIAGRLESRGPQGLIGDLQDFARRKPGVFLAGAALAGFAAARVGKAVAAAGSGSGGAQQSAARDEQRDEQPSIGAGAPAGTDRLQALPPVTPAVTSAPAQETVTPAPTRESTPYETTPPPPVSPPPAYPPATSPEPGFTPGPEGSV
jgi:hypothetical protein